MTPKEYYSSNIHKYTEQFQSLKKKSATISFFRLLAFVGAFAFIYLSIKHGGSINLLCIGLLIILFLVLVRISLSITAKKNLTRELIFINENEFSVLEGKENRFPDGDEITNRAMHINDLDILGRRSLFHLLNRTTTVNGHKMLADLLNNPLMNEAEIIAQQEAIKTIAPQCDIRQLITSNGLIEKEKEGKIEEVISWIKTEKRLTGKKWLNISRFVLPVINIAGFLYYLDTDNFIPMIIGIIISWIIIGSNIKYINKQHELTAKKSAILLQYAAILNHFYNASSGNSALLQELQHTSKNAHHEFTKLAKLTVSLDHRLNFIVNLLLNSFLLYDVHCMIALEKWKEKNKNKFHSWIEAVSKIETLGSLATFAFNNPEYCYPQIAEKETSIQAVQIAHPLIPYKEQVANDITAGAEEKLLLVTGSNMSGKSTFLRTLGVNLLLAQCGAPVCAEQFVFSPMKILSSVRISDSLQEHTSYFMAELIRLREIIDQLKTGIPAFVLIDEVLRGTNSDDKTHGSACLILKLINYNCLSLFATHDLSLSSLENDKDNKISNYCFESIIENGELKFDYKLHKGIATNKNATFLMKKMGII